MEKNYFLSLEKIKCEIEKKNGLNYISWSDAWREIKAIHPDATYKKIKNGDTYLFRSGTGGSVECEVTVNGITHCADLAITDFKNQEIKFDSIKSTDIQNTLQRAFAKAIAMHGIGLYVYRGEDIPKDVDDDANTASYGYGANGKKIVEYKHPKSGMSVTEYVESFKKEKDINYLKILFEESMEIPNLSEGQKELLISVKDQRKKYLQENEHNPFSK